MVKEGYEIEACGGTIPIPDKSLTFCQPGIDCPLLGYWAFDFAASRDRKPGGRVIDSLSADLRRELPNMKGFSSHNLDYMQKYAETYRYQTSVLEVLAQITH